MNDLAISETLLCIFFFFGRSFFIGGVFSASFCHIEQLFASYFSVRVAFIAIRMFYVVSPDRAANDWLAVRLRRSIN
jgi:hypothetical protein